MKNLYNNRDYLINSKFMSSVFDFKLILFRSSKDKDEKVDLNIRIRDLEEMGFLKSPGFPVLYLHDSRNFNNIAKNKIFLKNVYENSIKSDNYKVLINQDLIYRDFLPRSFVAYLPSNNIIDSTELYNFSKRCLNKFNRIVLDPLIGNNSPDWFVYDDESLNFLIKMDNSEFYVDKDIKIINDKIYFQDKLQYIALSSKEIKQIFINVNLNSEIKMKIDVTLNSNVNEILRKVNQKLKNSYPDLVFQPEMKIIKVRGLSDYIIDLEEPLGLFKYINDCINYKTIPEFIVLDSPYFNKESQLKDQPKIGLNGKRRSSSLNEFEKFQKNLVQNQTQNIFINRNKRQNPSVDTNILTKTTDKKICLHNQGNTVLTKLSNEISKINSALPSNKIQMALARNNVPVVISGGENKSVKSNLNYKRFENVAVFNENIINFSEFKGIRRRNPIDNINKIIQQDLISSEIDLNCKFIDNIIQKSIELKIKDENEESKKKFKTVEVDVDELLKKKSRSRSKGIRENSQSIKRNHSRNKVKDQQSSVKNNKITQNLQLDKYEDSITQLNNNINIQNVIRPFNIRLNLLRLNTNILKLPNIKTNPSNITSLSSIEIVAQIYCGNEQISKKIKIKKNFMFESFSNININTLLNFNLKYCDLSLFSSLIVKLKSNIEKKDKTKKKTIAWVNFRLFDHLKRLKTGKHKIYFWDSIFSHNSYFSSIDNNKTNKGELYFELESFQRPVEYQDNPEIDESDVNEDEWYLRNKPKENSILPQDSKIIENISNKSPFEELTNEEKQVLWRNRYTAIEKPDLICKIFKCVNKSDVNQMKELQKLTQICKFVPPVQALELLSGNFLNECVRRFAVDSLANVSYSDLSDYLLQLVQSLKYELYHDSYLARFLLKLGIKYPLTIGHSLFWNLKSEMFNTNVQQRFGLYLEIFLSKIGTELRKVYELEVYLVDRISKVCDVAFINVKNKSKEEINKKMTEELDKINEEFFCDKEVSIPFNYRIKVKRIQIKKCKFMKSKKRPLWLVFENSCNFGEDVYVIFKKGDDLRQDVITLQLFKIMHKLWFDEGLRLKMSNYEVISTGYFQGIVQIVTNSETLATIQKDYGSILSGFSDKPLKHWMNKMITKITEKEYVNNFILSTVAYCIATFVLGIGDRHNDNIMVKKNGELFHIDFGHFLGHFKYKYGIKRERAPFVFTSEFCNVIGGEKSENFELFKSLCIKAFKIIRQNANLFIIVLNSMLCTGLPELTCDSIKFLEYSLALNSKDTEAENFLIQKLKESMNSFSTKLNFAIHIIANK